MCYSLPNRIKEALEKYDRKHRLTFNPPHSSIIALKNLSSLDQNNLFKIYQCFRGNIPNPSRSSYKVYLATLVKIGTLEYGDMGYEDDDYRPKPMVNPNQVEDLLRLLDENNLLTQENFDAIKAYNNYLELTQALKLLKQANLFTQKNLTILIKTIFFLPASIQELLPCLKQHNLLIQKNFDNIITNPQFGRISDILSTLTKFSLVTQENIDKLLNPRNHFLCTTEISKMILTIPEHLFNQEMFDTLAKLVQQQNPVQRVHQYIEQQANLQRNCFLRS